MATNVAAVKAVPHEQEAAEWATAVAPGWTEVVAQGAVVRTQRMSGGLTNELYECRLHGAPKTGDVIDCVLVRHYGPGDGVLFSRPVEVGVSTALAERQLAPHIYGFFDGGRVEEYLPGSALQRRDMSLPSVRDRIAARFAQLHNCPMPLPHQPVLLSLLVR